MELLALLAVLGAIIFAPWVCLSLELGPLVRAAKSRQCAVQFHLVDFLCLPWLFVLIPLPIGQILWSTYHNEYQYHLTSGMIFVLDALLVVAAVAIWWNCARTLSRAGICMVWKRCVVLAVALPVAIVGSIAVPVLFFTAFFPSVQACLFPSVDQDNFPRVWLLLAEIPVIGVLYCFSRLTRAIVASAEKE
jgi:hypothetical protein